MSGPGVGRCGSQTRLSKTVATDHMWLWSPWHAPRVTEKRTHRVLNTCYEKKKIALIIRYTDYMFKR